MWQSGILCKPSPKAILCIMQIYGLGCAYICFTGRKYGVYIFYQETPVLLTDFYTFLKGVFWRFKLIAVILHVDRAMGVMGLMGDRHNGHDGHDGRR